MKKHELKMFRPDIVDGWCAFAFVTLMLSFIVALVVGGTYIFDYGKVWTGLAMVFAPPVVAGTLIALGVSHVADGWGPDQRRVYSKLIELKKLMGHYAPEISTSVIENMNETDSSNIFYGLCSLENEYIENQKAVKVRDYRIDEAKESINSKTEYLQQHTRELKAMECQ